MKSKRPYLETSAIFSECGLFRYTLTRRLSMGDRVCMFTGLNPSTATAEIDDPTIRRCVGFARSWGFDWLLMGNVCAYRSTDPKVLPTVADPVGSLNLTYLSVMASRAELVIAAWGGNKLSPAAQRVADYILHLSHTRCLGSNDDGTPKHPLYLSKLLKPQRIQL